MLPAGSILIGETEKRDEDRFPYQMNRRHPSYTLERSQDDLEHPRESEKREWVEHRILDQSEATRDRIEDSDRKRIRKRQTPMESEIRILIKTRIPNKRRIRRSKENQWGFERSTKIWSKVRTDRPKQWPSDSYREYKKELPKGLGGDPVKTETRCPLGITKSFQIRTWDQKALRSTRVPKKLQ